MKALISRLLGSEVRPARKQSIRLGLEGLCERSLPSATAALSGGTLVITSDGASDQVQVSETPFSVSVVNTATNATISAFSRKEVTRVLFNGQGGNDRFDGSGLMTLPATAHGDEGNDVLYGGWMADWLDAGNGDNLANGGSGNDVLLGGSGIDALQGQDGNDLIFGFGGNDVINAGVGDDTMFAGAGNDFVVGGDGSDHLIGESGDDVLHGSNGSDKIEGGLGADYLYGEGGNDSLWGNDTVYREPNGYGDGSVDYLFGGSGFDEFKGSFYYDIDIAPDPGIW